CGFEAYQGAGRCRTDPSRGARPHASLPPRARTAGKRPSMAQLLRALLDRAPDDARAAARRGKIPQTPCPETKEAMNLLAHPETHGSLIEPATFRIERLLPGTIERAWSYLIDSDLRRRWLAGGEMDLKVGAPFELVWRNDELTNPPGARPDGFGEEHRMS